MRSPLRARARARVRPSLSLLRATTAPPAPTHAGPSTGSHPRRPLRRRPSLYLSLRARLPEQGGGDEGFAAPTPSAAATRPQLVAVPDRGGGGGGGEGGGGVSGSAMRGGGGRQPYAAPDGADAASIPAASRKMVQSLKGILDDRWEGEIYSTLCDCGMDPDIAIERLISQDTFHEVRRKRDKKKEKICFNSHVHRVVTGQDIGKLTLRNLRGM